MCISVVMILLMTTSSRAKDCADAITKATNEPVAIATSLGQTATQLKAEEFAAVIVDQQLQDADPDEAERVLRHMGLATPVYINLAISGAERVIRELRTALHRRKKESSLARQGAEQKLRNELKDTVTALLLSCEMALQVPALSAAAQVKLRAVDLLAREMREKIGLRA
jgi:flagellar basal body-associated protein FliL